jgi:hypothetical protein
LTASYISTSTRKSELHGVKISRATSVRLIKTGQKYWTNKVAEIKLLLSMWSNYNQYSEKIISLFM